MREIPVKDDRQELIKALEDLIEVDVELRDCVGFPIGLLAKQGILIDNAKATLAKARSDMSGDRHPDWPMTPRCSCGAKPGVVWPMCHSAAMQGREAGADVDAENCERWINEATAAGWLSGEDECPA